ncbi:hypothetical protein ACKI19_00180 [Streptomyces caniscabiei]|uniref:hypothetical protein n=1 Tax=Streptomyces caniscabiei TaxID=2746961 RepID=UPI0038F648BC
MPKVSGMIPCPGATVEQDPWVPLKVTWHVDGGVQPLYLLVEGSGKGYVELKLHPDSGALMSLIVVDLPAEKRCASRGIEGQVFDFFTPAFDVTLWGHANSVATERRVVRAVGDLSYSQGKDSICLGFIEGASESVIKCGSVSVEVSKSGALARLVAKTQNSFTV